MPRPDARFLPVRRAFPLGSAPARSRGADAMSAVARLDPGVETQFDGLDLLSTAVIVLDQAARIVHVNQSAELLLSMSRKNLLGQSAERVIGDELQMQQLVADARANVFGERRQVLELKRLGREPVPVRVTATAQYGSSTPLVLEISEIEQQLKVDREERQLGLSEANRQLLRNLAHEIKNPLGGVRGAAQLLDAELASPEQREYTRVIIAEADRLQALVDRLLAPHRVARVVGRTQHPRGVRTRATGDAGGVSARPHDRA